MFSSLYPHHSSWMTIIIFGQMNDLELKKRFLTLILFFIFLEKGRKCFITFLYSIKDWGKSRSPSFWRFYESEFIRYDGLRKTWIYCCCDSSLISDRWVEVELMMLSNYIFNPHLISMCLNFCLFQNSAAQLIKISKGKAPMNMIPINLCICLIS